MPHSLVPIACKPWALNGLSERLVVSHYENDYGAAVRLLNAIGEELQTLDLATLPEHRIRAIKAEELAALASVRLHELYFGSLGGDGAALFTGSGPGTTMEEPVSSALEAQFGSVAAWRREFAALAGALSHGSGWALLTYSDREGRLYNQIAPDHSHALIGSVSVLALDMYEHAYHLDFGANVSAYIDAFMRNINWSVVSDRLMEATNGSARTGVNGGGDALASVSVEEFSCELEKSARFQVIDTRPKHYFSRSTDMMRGAVWRDPERVDEWWKELPSDAPVFVYCAYGYSVGRGVTAVLRERGIDARYIRGGLSAWYAAGGERALSRPNHV
jgi:Fe-Mn family superoxide dismutase